MDIDQYSPEELSKKDNAPLLGKINQLRQLQASQLCELSEARTKYEKTEARIRKTEMALRLKYQDGAVLEHKPSRQIVIVPAGGTKDIQWVAPIIVE